MGIFVRNRLTQQQVINRAEVLKGAMDRLSTATTGGTSQLGARVAHLSSSDRKVLTVALKVLEDKDHASKHGSSFRNLKQIDRIVSVLKGTGEGVAKTDSFFTRFKVQDVVRRVQAFRMTHISSAERKFHAELYYLMQKESQLAAPVRELSCFDSLVRQLEKSNNEINGFVRDLHVLQDPRKTDEHAEILSKRGAQLKELGHLNASGVLVNLNHLVSNLQQQQREQLEKIQTIRNKMVGLRQEIYDQIGPDKAVTRLKDLRENRAALVGSVETQKHEAVERKIAELQPKINENAQNLDAVIERHTRMTNKLARAARGEYVYPCPTKSDLKEIVKRRDALVEERKELFLRLRALEDELGRPQPSMTPEQKKTYAKFGVEFIGGHVITPPKLLNGKIDYAVKLFNEAVDSCNYEQARINEVVDHFHAATSLDDKLRLQKQLVGQREIQDYHLQQVLDFEQNYKTLVALLPTESKREPLSYDLTVLDWAPLTAIIDRDLVNEELEKASNLLGRQMLALTNLLDTSFTRDALEEARFQLLENLIQIQDLVKLGAVPLGEENASSLLQNLQNKINEKEDGIRAISNSNDRSREIIELLVSDIRNALNGTGSIYVS